MNKEKQKPQEYTLYVGYDKTGKGVWTNKKGEGVMVFIDVEDAEEYVGKDKKNRKYKKMRAAEYRKERAESQGEMMEERE